MIFFAVQKNVPKMSHECLRHHTNALNANVELTSKTCFKNVYIYKGGLFEWLLLQDIYGKDLFPTTTEILDILRYKPENIL